MNNFHYIFVIQYKGMKRLVVFLFVLAFVATETADAQRWRTRRYEAFIGGGTANHYGDIGGAYLDAENWYGLKDIQIKFTRPAITGGFKYKINHRFYARTVFTGAYFTANDLDTDKEATRDGGYKFRSWVFEPSAQVEFYILPEDRAMGSMALYNRRGLVNSFSQVYLYVFTGVGGVLNFPKVTEIATGNVVTDDGWGMADVPFRRFGLVVPAGIGVKLSLSSFWTVSAEFGRRIAFTDYIDGYTSKFSDSNDTYDFITVTASYKIKTTRKGLPVIFNRYGLH
jgi:hypothetical protein